MLHYLKMPFYFVRRRPWTTSVVGVVLCATAVLGINLWAWSHFRAAQEALSKDEMDEAQQHIAQCLRVWWRGPATQLLAARIERVSGHYPEAEQHITECVHLQHGASEATQLEEVLLRAQAGELKEVEAGLWKCIETDHPESAQILETLAKIYMRDSRLGAAIATLNLWLEREPQTVRAWHWRGWARERLDQPGKAITDYQRAVELDPKRWGVRLRLLALLLSHNPDEARPHAEELSRSHSDEPELLIVLAQYYQLRGEEDKAIEFVDRALAAQPNNFDALSLRGRLVCQRHPEEGEVWLRRAVAERPSDPRTLYSLYQCLEQLGKESEAAKILTRHTAIEIDSKRLAELMNHEIERAPDDPDLLSEVGAIQLRLGDEKMGVAWLQRALHENEYHKPSLEILLQHYESQGNEEEAAKYRQQLARVKGPNTTHSSRNR
jgi:tetratricopeptide (TPR) repeat protein